MEPAKRRDETKRGLKEEIKKLKEMSWKEIPGYLWGYYRFHALAIIVILIGVYSFATTWIQNNKPDIYNGMCINVISNKEHLDDYYKSSLATYFQLEPNDYNASLQTNLMMNLEDNSMAEVNYSTTISLQANLAAKEVDFIIGPKSTLETITSSMGAFFNLETTLSSERYNQYKESILSAVNDEGETIPCLLDISKSTFVTNMEFENEEPLYIGFVLNSKRTNYLEPFIDYLFTTNP